jgi:antitoxin FitA
MRGGRLTPVPRPQAERMLCIQSDIMAAVANVQIRGVPDDVHRRLKSQAALAGQSLNDYLLARMTEIARLPTIPELVGRIAGREPYTGPSSAAVIRAERGQR